jgi:hypothetical protein
MEKQEQLHSGKITLEVLHIRHFYCLIVMVNLWVWYVLSLDIDRLIYNVVVKSDEKYGVYCYKEKHDTLACKQHIYFDAYVQRN